MENNTDKQYSVNEEKLRFANKGQNLLKQVKPHTYHIRMYKQVRGNLLEMKSNILINSNLPFMSWNYQNVAEKTFFEELKDFVKKPIFQKFVVLNRKQANKSSRWGNASFNSKALDFDKISFSWGDNLLKDIDEETKNKFVKKVRDIVDSQRFATNEEETDFNRYFALLQEVDNLRRQAVTTNNYGYYREKKDETKKFTLEDEDYNNKLKVVETELCDLNHKYEYLNLPNRFDYIEDEEEEDPHNYDDDEDYDDE